MHKKTAVVALGGNAIMQKGEEGNIHQQFANTRRTLTGIMELIKHDYRLVITHGNVRIADHRGNVFAGVQGRSQW